VSDKKQRTPAGNRPSRCCSEQIGRHDSLRGIGTSLGVDSPKWYHLDLKDIKQGTLSDAMKNRSYESFESG